MTKHALDPARPRAQLEARRQEILRTIDRPLAPVATPAEPLPDERLTFMLREAEDLYWNELAWEELTDEERVAGGHLTELVFPGFLALVDGLLPNPATGGPYGAPRAYPQTVEAILFFLARRLAEITADLESGADSVKLVWARAMTAHLIDLTLYRLYRLTPAERERLESRG